MYILKLDNHPVEVIFDGSFDEWNHRKISHRLKKHLMMLIIRWIGLSNCFQSSGGEYKHESEGDRHIDLLLFGFLCEKKRELIRVRRPLCGCLSSAIES